MKTFVLTLFCFLGSLLMFSQDEDILGVLESDTTWLKEIIKFPISFATEIKYTGYEDLRFTKEWRNQNSEDFWCYMFVWHVDGIQKPTATDLEQQLKFYYNGLMAAVNKKKDFEVPNTKVNFIKTDDKEADFLGRVYMYDSFSSEGMITLNVQVKSYYCKINNTTNIVFELSPQGFVHEIWERFKTIKIKNDICDK
ncbi:hypothetical protein [Psychroserpens sp. MEBiC05023]